MNKFTFSMKKFIKSLSIIGIFCFAITGYGQGETEFVPQKYTLTTPACVMHAKDYEGQSTIPRPQELIDKMARGTACSTFIVNYNGFTPEAQAAFQFAVDIWANSIESTQPITISADFQDLGPGVLGRAGPQNFHTSNAPGSLPNVFYPKAIAEKLADAQIDPDPFGNSVDITAQFSSTFNWYYGTDGLPPPGQFDFVTVVLHEIGHGLGFVGFGRVPVTNGVPDPNPPVEGVLRNGGLISIFDNFIENGSSVSITSFADPSAALLSEFTSNNLFCNSTLAVGQNGSVIPPTNAPSTFQPGSSYSHWDESTFPNANPNSLMTPSVGSGVAIHDPGPITLGFFEDMGWSICGGSLTTKEFTLASVEISPNPFTSSIDIKLTNGLSDNYSVNLFDINGRIVVSESLTASNGTITLSSLDNLEDALYFVKITNNTNGSSITKKVIKR